MNYSANGASEVGVNVQLTSDAQNYDDCAAFTASTQPELDLRLTSHACRSEMAYVLCERGKLLALSSVTDTVSCCIKSKLCTGWPKNWQTFCTPYLHIFKFISLSKLGEDS